MKDINISKLAIEIGVYAPQLHKQTKECQEFGQGSFPDNDDIKQTQDQKRIHELKRKFKDAELERNILKKQSIFSKNSR